MVVHRTRTISQGVTVCPALFAQYGYFVHSRRSFRLQDGVSGIPGLLNRLRPTLSADDHDWRIYEAVCDHHRRARADLRNAGARVFPGFDAGDNGSLDVVQPA